MWVLFSRPAEADEDDDDDRLQVNGTLAASDRRFHCCASSSGPEGAAQVLQVPPGPPGPPLLSHHFTSLDDSFLSSHDHLFHSSAALLPFQGLTCG